MSACRDRLQPVVPVHSAYPDGPCQEAALVTQGERQLFSSEIWRHILQKDFRPHLPSRAAQFNDHY